MKKKSREELKEYLFNHKLFPIINKPYTHRNLELEFELMIEHHESGSCKCHKSGGLPKNIVAAWKNWIPYTKQDPELVAAYQQKLRIEEQRRFEKQYNVGFDKPNLEGLKKLAELKEKLLNKNI